MLFVLVVLTADAVPAESPSLEVEAASYPLNLIVYRGEEVSVSGEHLKGEMRGAVTVKLTSSATVLVPPRYEVRVMCDSASVMLDADDSLDVFPKRVWVTARTGRVSVVTPFPSKVVLTTVGGEITVEGEPIGSPDDWADASYRLRAGSGAVSVESPMPWNLTVSSVNGPVSVSLDEPPVADADWFVYTSSGKVTARVADERFEGRFKVERGGFKLQSWTIEQIGEGHDGPDVPPPVSVSGGPLADYSRVKGVALGMGLGARTDRGHRGYGSVAYDLAARRAEYLLLVSPQFSYKPDSRLVFAMFDTTSTEDEWYYPPSLNALASLFFKVDQRDYYERRGASAAVEFDAWRTTTLSLGYEASLVDTLSKATDWAFFGPPTFRANPAVPVGQLTLVTGRVAYANAGTRADVRLERTLRDRDTLYDFTRVVSTVELRRNQRRYTLYARLGLGWSPAALPQPFAFELGGLGTVPAIAYKSLSGDRCFLLNLVYGWKLRWLLFTSQVEVFTDVAGAWGAAQPTTASGVGADFGMGFSPFGSGLTVRLAQDVSDRRVRVLFLDFERTI